MRWLRQSRCRRLAAYGAFGRMVRRKTVSSHEPGGADHGHSSPDKFAWLRVVLPRTNGLWQRVTLYSSRRVYRLVKRPNRPGILRGEKPA